MNRLGLLIGRVPIGLLVAAVLGLGCGGCGESSAGKSGSVLDTITEDTTRGALEEVSRSVALFGVETEGRTDMEVLLELRSKGIVQFDDSVSDLPFVLEFAGVPFGLNADKGHGRGFNFITSQHDAKTVKRLVKEISKYYGEPGIDGDQEEPEYCYYGWNTWNPDYPTVRIRPVHKEDGGLTMFWDF